MRLLLDRLLLELAVQYGVCAALSDVLHLDSSSESKFSRHVLVRLPHAVFRDNSSVGGFVRHLVDCIAAEATEDDDMRRLLLWTHDPAAEDTPPPAPPIDCGVYSRYRSFRLLWSSKRKPNAPVLHCHHSQQYTRAASQRSVWMHSCVQYMEKDRHSAASEQPCSTLTWPPGQPLQSDSSAAHVRIAQPATGHRPAASHCLLAHGVGNIHGCPTRLTASRPLLGACACLSSTEAAGCLLRSLLHAPAVDELQRALSDENTWPASPTAASVSLRSHTLLCLGSEATAGAARGVCEAYRLTLVYSVTGSRYCARVDRAHRSNGIYFVVTAHCRSAASTPLSAAAAAAVPPPRSASVFHCSAAVFVQRCHDFDCKGFSSEPIALPAEIAQRMFTSTMDSAGRERDEGRATSSEM